MIIQSPRQEAFCFEWEETCSRGAPWPAVAAADPGRSANVAGGVDPGNRHQRGRLQREDPGNRPQRGRLQREDPDAGLNAAGYNATRASRLQGIRSLQDERFARPTM